MALFKSEKTYLGVDLGTSAVKVVELKEEKGRPRLVTYGYAEQPTNIIRSDSTEDQEKIIKILKEVISKANIKAERAIAALPSFAVFSSIISLPAMSRKDLLSAIRWEAKKFVPMPLEEMVLDWKILKEDSKEMTVKKAGESEGAGQINRQGTGTEVIKVKNIKVLLTAAPKDLVNRYVEIFRKAGKTLSNLETESFAIERSLIGSDKSIVMVVDIGAVVTNISIFSEGIPLLNRSIDIGGETITKAIANSLKIDQSRAEQFKRDFGLSASGGYQESIPKTIEFVISSILNEIKHVINLFRSREGGELEKIILTGGSAFLPNLPEYLSNILNLKVHVGDPWARVIYPLDLKPVLDEIAPQMAVAIGLAMRDII